MTAVPTPLGLLHPGDRGRIASVVGDDPVAIRLLEMGLLPGEDLEVIGVAPMGDPIAVRIGETRVALRRRDANRISITAHAGTPASFAPTAAAVAPT